MTAMRQYLLLLSLKSRTSTSVGCSLFRSSLLVLREPYLKINGEHDLFTGAHDECASHTLGADASSFSRPRARQHCPAVSR